FHRERRENGGAYGAYAQAGVASATFYFGSYRDPNIVRTYDIFDAAISWVTDGDIEAEALKEAILGACGDVDPLESPDIKGRREATNRATAFTRQPRELFTHRLFWPAVLILSGLYFLARNLGWLEWLRADIFWPLVLIAVGAWLILRRGRR